MKRFGVRAQLWFLSASLSVLLLGIAAAGLYGMKSARDGLATVYGDRIVPLKQLKVIADMYAVNIVDSSHKVRSGEMSWADGRKNVSQSVESIHQNWKAYLATELVSEEKKLVDEIAPLLAAADRLIKELADLLQAQDKDALVSFIDTRLYKTIDPVSGKFSDLVDVQLTVAKSEFDASASRYALFFKLFVGAVMCGAFCIVLLVGFARTLLKQLGGEPAYAVEIANKVAAGDLSVHVSTKAHDDASLLAALKNMRDSLAGIVSEVRSGTDAISGASGQIAAGNADLSQRTEEQASSLEETASSMEELTSTVKQNAENARQANQLAAGASAIAVKGGEVVGQVVETMASINEASKQIADIISVIDGIAFQTNILALNAAVEAARAGEQGRGFAVVATEVRSLAQRSAAAAKEIKALIGNSVEKVGNGTKLVDEAGRTMQEVVSSVKRVTDIISEIAAASQEQSSGIEQVNAAVMQMDQVTQQNAALVEEAAAAADSMQHQARVLSKAVAVFQVAQEGAAAVRAAAPAAEAAPAKVERRSPNRAKNVARLPKKAEAVAVSEPHREPKRTGTDGEWNEF